MDSNLEKEIVEKDFDSQKYVAGLALQAVGTSDLKSQRQKIQSIADDTNGLLKKNVYQHYMQFIDTAKEISYLEGEMYQLAHMLTEQKALLASLLDMSITGVKFLDQSDDVTDNKSFVTTLDSIKESVDGCDHIVNVTGRELEYDSDMIELDATSYTAIHRVHGYLFNDGFMLAKWVASRRQGKRYTFHVWYDINTLAVVNVKDTEEISNSFKLMMFPDTKLIQCANKQIKNDWLDAFDRVKKGKRTEVSPTPTEEVFSSPDEDDSTGFFSRTNKSGVEIPDWVMEATDDLDVYIAQREFEEAVELLEAGEKFCKECGDSKPKHLEEQLKTRRNAVINCLVQVLEVSPDKSLQGGPRAARRAVHLLIRLGRSVKACELFLARRSALLAHSQRQLRIEGTTIPYVSCLSFLFFNSLVDASAEFDRAFKEGSCNRSAFGIWASNQLRTFLQTFQRQVFNPEVALSQVGECVQTLKCHSKKLEDIGLDASYIIDSKLEPSISRTLRDARDMLLEAVRHRASDDTWRPVNLNNKQGVKKLVDDMSAVGIAGIVNYIYDDHWLSLTANTIQFAKGFLSFLDDGLKLAVCQLTDLLDSSIRDIFMDHMQHVNASLGRMPNERKIIIKNAGFLVDTVLSLAEHRYQERLGVPCSTLAQARKQLGPLAQGTSVGVSTGKTGFL